LYLEKTDRVNNWDLVDTSADKLLGAFLEDKDRSILDELAESHSLWEQRIAMIATYYFIKHDDFKDALRIARTLRDHQHDLIHKAVGWMLREIGNRDKPALEKFLKRHYLRMPRTMLRYAIEKFPERQRQRYLRGKV
jgi:3-methyladenine DNA glycosylase AlkD